MVKAQRFINTAILHAKQNTAHITILGLCDATGECDDSEKIVCTLKQHINDDCTDDTDDQLILYMPQLDNYCLGLSDEEGAFRYSVNTDGWWTERFDSQDCTGDASSSLYWANGCGESGDYRTFSQVTTNDDDDNDDFIETSDLHGNNTIVDATDGSASGSDSDSANILCISAWMVLAVIMIIITMLFE